MFNNFTDSFFNKVESKTKIGKSTIIDLASKLQKSDLKNEEALRDVIKELSAMTGKDVSKEREDKIVEAVMNDKIPKDIEKMI
ncbi:MAG: stage VI sporulation protein F [Bacilli bacterium]|nr:stage VI sporulation protein F [Bacilli bacterium]